MFQSDKSEELTRLESLLGVADDPPAAAATDRPGCASDRLAYTIVRNGAAGVVSGAVVGGAKGAAQNSSQTRQAETNGR